MAELLIIGGIVVTSAVVGGYLVKRRNKKLLDAQVFGKALTDFKLKHLEPNVAIPSPVQWIMRAIEERGLVAANLFQTQGLEARLKEIATNVNKDQSLLKKYLSSEPINVVGGLLVHFFRELPTSIFPQDLFTDIINIEKNNSSLDSWIYQSQGILDKMPLRNQSLVQRLMGLLNSLKASPDAEAQAQTNAMIFSPNLFFTDNFEVAEVLDKESHHIREFVRKMILNFESVFKAKLSLNHNVL